MYNIIGPHSKCLREKVKRCAIMDNSLTDKPADIPALAAVVYAPDDKICIDAVLSEVAEHLGARGIQLGGAIQHNVERENRCRCDMLLKDLGTGEVVPISEDRGPAARGCSLDVPALERLAGMTQASLDKGIDLLIANRFGKSEAEGRGFRSAIENALACAIPVLVAVNHDNKASLVQFTGGYHEQLQADPSEILKWCLHQIDSREIPIQPHSSDLT